jgi:hypothetical protein
MSAADNREAGKRWNASGPEFATAESPAIQSSPNGQPAPEEKSSGKVEPSAINHATDSDGGEIDIDAAGSIIGANLLDRIHDFVRRFVSYPSIESSIAHVLWIGHTHLMNAWFTTPRLAVLSPEPGSGKSRLLEISALLVPRPLLSVMSSPAYILRRIADQDNRPTILCDEIDAIFGPNAHGSEDLRAMINAGYRRGATVGRCYPEKGKILTHDLATYGAIALGGLGDLPSTIMSRSIVIPMRKRAPGESAEPFRPALHEPEGNALRDELASWAETVFGAAETAEPVMPQGIADRNADVWSPLLTVGELAGGRWPNLARDAAIAFVQSAKADGKPSIGVQLLADIRRCIGGEDQVPTQDLLERLLADDEAPWGDLRGRRLDARKLAGMLSQYGIKSTGLRVGNSTPKGYKRDAFYDAWARYLSVSAGTATSATTATGDEDPLETRSSSAADKITSPPCGGHGGGVAERESQ